MVALTQMLPYKVAPLQTQKVSPNDSRHCINLALCSDALTVITVPLQSLNWISVIYSRTNRDSEALNNC